MAFSSIEEGEFTDVNDSFLKILGYTRKDIIGKTSAEIELWVDPKTRKTAIEKIKQTGSIENFETKVFTKNKEIVDVLFSISLNEFKGKQELLSTMIDITEKTKMNEIVANAQKLESIGILAAGIAHDYNNQLQGISGNLELSKLKLQKLTQTIQTEENIKTINQILQFIARSQDAVARSYDLTEQLRTYAKGGLPQKEITLLKELLPDWIKFTLSGTGNIRTTLDIADDLWPTEIDTNQINQVVSNLVINATHAMPHGGALKVTARNIVIRQDTDKIIPPGNYILLNIIDTGIGIPKENINKIFNPFFTTKLQGTGTGMGLSTAYSIIKKHQGFLTVKSEIGQGTIFKILLPAAPDAEIVPQAVLEKEKPSWQGRILLMDDEESIVASTKEMLTESGFKEVITSSKGEDAIELFSKAKAENNPFTLVILDLTIRNGLGGEETMKAIRNIDQDVPVIVASEYSDNNVISNFKDYGFSYILKKPYSLEDINNALSKLFPPDNQDPENQ